MELVKLIEKTAISAVLIIGITACSSKPEIKEFPKSANVKQEITNLETAIDNSKSKDTDLLAPVSYKEARNSLQKAKEMDKDDSISTKSVLNKVALGQAYVDRSLSRAEENRMKLQDVLVARQVATDARANTLLPSEFTKLDKKLKEVTADIENRNEKKYQEKRAALITGYMDLELAAIKKSHLAESRFLIDEAVKNGASKLTPKTLATTNEKYQEVDQFITRDRHNASEIETRTSSLLTEARNLEATTATALGLSAATPEETALRMQAEENRLNRTRNALADEQGTNVALEASNSEMMRDKKLNAIYEE